MSSEERINNLVAAETELAKLALSDFADFRTDLLTLKGLSSEAFSLDDVGEKLFVCVETRTDITHAVTLTKLEELRDRLSGNVNYLINAYACAIAEHDKADGKNRLGDHE